MVAILIPPPRTEHQHRFTGFDLSPVVQCVVAGAVGHQETTGDVERPAFKHGHQAFLRNQRLLGKIVSFGKGDHRLPDLHFRWFCRNGGGRPKGVASLG